MEYLLRALANSVLISCFSVLDQSLVLIQTEIPEYQVLHLAPLALELALCSFWPHPFSLTVALPPSQLWVLHKAKQLFLTYSKEVTLESQASPKRDQRAFC